MTDGNEGKPGFVNVEYEEARTREQELFRMLAAVVYTYQRETMHDAVTLTAASLDLPRGTRILRRENFEANGLDIWIEHPDRRPDLLGEIE